MMDYINKLNKAIEVALEEPNQDTDYIKGLQQAVGIAESGGCSTKQDLVMWLTDMVMEGLTTDMLSGVCGKEPEYLVIRGLVTGLKEAMNLSGKLDLPKYTVETPIHKMVKDERGDMLPLKFVSGKYDEYWLMPEILVKDVTFVDFARLVG